MAHPIKDSPTGGRHEILRSLYHLYAFPPRNGVTPAHVSVDLRRRSRTPDPDLEAHVLQVIGDLRDDGHVTGGHRLTSPVSLTRAGAAIGKNPMPPSIIGPGRADSDQDAVENY